MIGGRTDRVKEFAASDFGVEPGEKNQELTQRTQRRRVHREQKERKEP
jgi:hypothetical protein